MQPFKPTRKWADQVYLQPLTVEVVTSIIEKEKPDGILLGFGGQTALNLGLALEEAGVLAEHQVAVLGTRIAAIRQTEDRDCFKKELEGIKVKSPKSICATSVDAALSAAPANWLSCHDALRVFFRGPWLRQS